MGIVRVVVTMMDQINEHFHSDSVSNINTIVYHSRVALATFVSIPFRDVEDRRLQIWFIKIHQKLARFVKRDLSKQSIRFLIRKYELISLVWKRNHFDSLKRKEIFLRLFVYIIIN